MILILAILAATRAYPTSLQSPPLVSRGQLHVLQPSCGDPNGCRSLTDIIRSCIITLFLCTWVSIHPNIPSPDDGWPRVAWRRAGLMLLSLTVPEAVIGLALRQRLAAAELAEKHKGEGWTITHGFFAIMGGFMEYEGNRPIRVLLPDQLESYSLTGNGDFPRISKAEIEDKSKGDAISKGFVIFQTGWFVTQCIARGVQGLPITELELVTVAFAALNFVIYILWWDKPLNVQRGIRVYKKRITEGDTDDGKVEAVVGFWDSLGNALSEIPGAIVRGPNTETDWPWLFRVLLQPILGPVYSFLGCEDEDLEKRVDTFYPTAWVAGSETLATCVVATIALVFGGIHCIAWSFPFPSSIEQTLWRVAALSITGLSIVISSIGVLVTEIDSYELCSMMTLLLPLILYILGRFVLLVLPLLSLRSLSPAAFHVVQWTSFIPHV